MNFTLTIEAGPGLIGTITLLTNAISGMLGQQPAQPSLSKPAVDEPKQEPAQSKPEPQATDKRPAAAENTAEPDQPAEIVKIEELRAAAVAAGKDKAKQLLDKLGHKKLTDIPEPDRAAFLAELKGA